MSKQSKSTTANDAANKKADDFDFAANMQELEAIVDWFESDSSDIDASLQKYSRGMELAEQLKAHLQTVDNQVKKIQARFADDDELN